MINTIENQLNNTLSRLNKTMELDLGFHEEDSSEMSHDFHAFPAKFPPQLPRVFIENLTNPGEVVLDPMMGSGTCVLEAISLERNGIGLDIDPLAVLLSKVKTTPLDNKLIEKTGNNIIVRAEKSVEQYSFIEKELSNRFSPKTKDFIDYWFSLQTQIELMALILEIEKIDDPKIKTFFELIFSAIVITKSGGVSLAWDLAHTRPHKLKQGIPKGYKPAIKDFKKRLRKNLQGLSDIQSKKIGNAIIGYGNAECIPIANDSIDLIFTSPPYASNAIDYMRAHKFSLVWLGKEIEDLSNLRSKYIGGEKVANFNFQSLPKETQLIVNRVFEKDSKKSAILHRYYSEMFRVLGQFYRVLKPGKSAIIVVGSSTMRGIDTRTQDCISEMGIVHGFDLIGINTRQLDRDRRMLPISRNHEVSQIQERMHEEFVIALQKPLRGAQKHGKN